MFTELIGQFLLYTTPHTHKSNQICVLSFTLKELKGVLNMVQTDSQFKAFIRFVLDALRDIAAEKDEKIRTAKMEKVLDNLQKTLED